MGKDDLLWDLLGEASEQKPNVFFARNVVRETRKLAETQPSWRQLITNVLSTKKSYHPDRCHRLHRPSYHNTTPDIAA